jgi:hypothetical protein
MSHRPSKHSISHPEHGSLSPKNRMIHPPTQSLPQIPQTNLVTETHNLPFLVHQIDTPALGHVTSTRNAASPRRAVPRRKFVRSTSNNVNRHQSVRSTLSKVHVVSPEFGSPALHDILNGRKSTLDKGCSLSGYCQLRTYLCLPRMSVRLAMPSSFHANLEF